MCGPIPPVFMIAGSQMLGGIGRMAYQNSVAAQNRIDAAGELDTAQAQAERILRATERQRGAARAATAASGAAIDEFALGTEREILAAGETDAAMTILTGERRARSLNHQAEMREAAGLFAMGSSLFDAASTIKGWKGIKGVPGAGD